MSRIERLIKEKCPSGVEYKKLKDIGKTYSGLSGKSKDDFVNGNYKFITYMNIYNNPSVRLNQDDKVFINDNEKQNAVQYGDILIAGSSENMEDSGMISVVCEKPVERIYLNSFCFGFRLNDKYKSKILPDFSKHVFRSSSFRKQILFCSFGVTRYNLKKKKFLELVIPIPPIEVQEEIVKILDKFDELKDSLEVELEMRRSQFEFWRTELMNLKDVEYKEIPLSQIYDYKYGTGNTIPDIGGSYPVYGSNGIVGTHNEYNSEDSPVIGHIGAYAGIVNWAAGKHFVTYNGVICKKINDEVDSRYAFYLLLNQDFLGEQKGAQPFVSYDSLRKPIVKIPNISIQKRIASILDKFNTLINDIHEGIPAEIEARRKQYEYYRDKLLSFKEVSHE